MDGQTTTDLDEAEGEVVFGLASGGLVEGHPPVVDHSREGAVVFVCVVGCVGFPWEPHRGHTNTPAQSQMMCVEASPWYQMAPLMVIRSSGWIIAFHKTEFLSLSEVGL